MSYEINVALNGRHYFATDKRSLTNAKAASAMVVDFVKRFPATDGFKISVSYNPEIGYCTSDLTSADIPNIEARIESLGEDD